VFDSPQLYFTMYQSRAQPSLLCFTTAVTVSFSQSTYNLNEDSGPAQPVLILSNPSSTDITVQVSTSDGTATGEECTAYK